jgi:hypothetical protein
LTKIITKDEITELYNINNIPLKKVEFLRDGFVINIDNAPLHNEKIHNLMPRRWHIYTIENHRIVGLCSLSDSNLEEVKKFIEEIKND